MESDEEILHRLAKDGSMDFKAWEILLPGLIARIERIAHTEFPVPNIPSHPTTRAPAPRFLMPIPSSDPIAPTDSAPSSQETDKENAFPPSSAGATSVPTSSRRFSNLPPLVQPPIPPGSLPGPIAGLLKEVTSTLMENFDRYPPHTVQRLAELVLEPKRHYRSLTAYLHALDRVVHVTSGNNVYPLPPAVPDMSQMSLLSNGVGGVSNRGGLQINTAAANSLGSDESLGGALLTPIPWLARPANGGGSEDGAASSDEGSTSSPISASPTAGTVEQMEAQSAPQPAPDAPQHQLQPRPQPQTSTSPPTGDEAPSTRPQVRTESTETIEGPNGIGSIETVSVSVNGVPSTGAVLTSRGVTQGELLRQEQRAGVVPLSQLVRQAQQQQQQQQQQHQQQKQQAQAQAQASAATTDAEPEEERTSNGAVAADASMEGVMEEEIPHARGPSEIDDVDTGPQAGSGGATHLAVGSTSASGQPVVKMQGIDVEAAVGRRADGTSLRSSSPSSPSPPPPHPEEDGRKTSAEKGGEEVVPRSPKREAEDGLDQGQGKKVKVAEGETAGGEVDDEEEYVFMDTDKPAGEDGVTAAGLGEHVQKPETDVEGDVIIRDQVPGDGEGAGDKSAARGEAGPGKGA